MLLNELQKQIKLKEELAAQMAEQKALTQKQLAALKASTEQEAEKRTALEKRFANLERTIVAQHAGRNVEAAFNR
jgi:phage shock protein A